MKIKRRERRGGWGGESRLKALFLGLSPVTKGSGKNVDGGGGGGGVSWRKKDRQGGGWERGGRSANYRSYTLIAMFSLALTNTLHTRAYVVWLRPPG